MKFRTSHPRSDMDVLIEHGRIIEPIPSSVRVRALERARSTTATAPTQPLEAIPIARQRGITIMLAASLAFIVGAAAAAVAIRVHTPKQGPPKQALSSHAEAAACATPAAFPPAARVPPAPSMEPKAARAESSLTARESYAAELGLLQRAQAAYADRNYATTLLLVSEHAHRFPNGRLADEREALHVKALIGAGRDAEARKAASAFAGRFPRSALLPRLSTPGGSD